MIAGTAKRGYSREFTPKTERRIKIEIDRVPPTLNDALRAKVKRHGLSIRSVTLQLWKAWIQEPLPAPPERGETPTT
jgi:hypothetical protein